MTTLRDLQDSLSGLKVWTDGSRRAPHKPLLVLLVLAAYARGEGGSCLSQTWTHGSANCWKTTVRPGGTSTPSIRSGACATTDSGRSRQTPAGHRRFRRLVTPPAGRCSTSVRVQASIRATTSSCEHVQSCRRRWRANCSLRTFPTACTTTSSSLSGCRLPTLPRRAARATQSSGIAFSRLTSIERGVRFRRSCGEQRRRSRGRTHSLAPGGRA